RHITHHPHSPSFPTRRSSDLAHVPLHREPDVLTREDSYDFREDFAIQQDRASKTIAKRANVGDTVGMTWRKIRNLTLLAAALACLWLSACRDRKGVV